MLFILIYLRRDGGKKSIVAVFFQVFKSIIYVINVYTKNIIIKINIKIKFLINNKRLSVCFRSKMSIYITCAVIIPPIERSSSDSVNNVKNCKI